MNNTHLVLSLLFACGALPLGMVIGWVARTRLIVTGVDGAAHSELLALRARAGQVQEERARERAQWEARLRDLEGRVREEREARELLEQRENCRHRELLAQQNRVMEVLAPVTRSLSDMSDVLGRAEAMRAQQMGELATQLQQAREMDLRLQKVATSLDEALRNPSARGRWGEVQLRNVVESVGLREGIDFDMQVVVSSASGTVRPDLILRLPGGRRLIVDAKAPFDAFLKAHALRDDPVRKEERERLLRDHARSLRGHVDALAKRAYWEHVEGAADFVIAFLPSEGALSAALDADHTLLDHAFGCKVALASPVSLWSVVRSVEWAWQQQRIADETAGFLEAARTLHSRLATLATHATTLRRSIERTVEAWNSFAGSLESRVLPAARKLDGIDGASIMAVEDIDELPRDVPRLRTGAEETAAGEWEAER